MSNGTGDLIQSTLEDYDDNSWCGSEQGKWCVRASVFGVFGQLSGRTGPMGGDDRVRIEYLLVGDGET